MPPTLIGPAAGLGGAAALHENGVARARAWARPPEPAIETARSPREARN
ncbi:hypothetical protein GCM10009734_97290 [Nonomuraea bangladeshensis]